jgi:hypothetical protein
MNTRQFLPPLERTFIRQAAFIFCWICTSQGSDLQEYDILDINELHPK